jgi:hypothetical protein
MLGSDGPIPDRGVAAPEQAKRGEVPTVILMIPKTPESGETAANEEISGCLRRRRQVAATAVDYV